MFLIRSAFWLAVVVMLLPTDEKQQARFASFAVNSVHHLATFCDRNVKTCEVGGDMWALFVRKFEYGTRLAMDIASDRKVDVVDRPPAAAPPASPGRIEPARVRGANTLAPTDHVPPWRGYAAARSGT
jgi:hypothetical protein